MIDIQKGEEKLRIATCHLESFLEDAAIRSKQISQFKELFPKKENIIFLGDFNFGDGEVENALLNKYTDAWKMKYPAKAGFTWNKEKSAMARAGSFKKEKSRRLDRIFIRGKVLVKECTILRDQPVDNAKTIFPSDHFGLTARIIL